MDGNLELNRKTYDRLYQLRDLCKVVEYENLTVLDLGVTSKLSPGRAEKLAPVIAESSMGLLGKVKVNEDGIKVDIKEHPGIATLGCQLAGWSIPTKGGSALGSGPARIPAKKPRDIIEAIGYKETSEKTALILETDRLPEQETLEGLPKAAGSGRMIMAAFRGDSHIGLVNVLARVVEMALFRLNFLEYDVTRIESASGLVPMPDEGDAFSANDAIIYQGSVTIGTRGWDEKLSAKAVSSASESYGQRFRTVYEAAGRDFYRIDPAVFAPAELKVTDTLTGRQHTFGKKHKLE